MDAEEMARAIAYELRKLHHWSAEPSRDVIRFRNERGEPFELIVKKL